MTEALWRVFMFNACLKPFVFWHINIQSRFCPDLSAALPVGPLKTDAVAGSWPDVVDDGTQMCFDELLRWKVIQADTPWPLRKSS